MTHRSDSTLHTGLIELSQVQSAHMITPPTPPVIIFQFLLIYSSASPLQKWRVAECTELMSPDRPSIGIPNASIYPYSRGPHLRAHEITLPQRQLHVAVTELNEGTRVGPGLTVLRSKWRNVGRGGGAVHIYKLLPRGLSLMPVRTPELQVSAITGTDPHIKQLHYIILTWQTPRSIDQVWLAAAFSTDAALRNAHLHFK